MLAEFITELKNIVRLLFILPGTGLVWPVWLQYIPQRAIPYSAHTRRIKSALVEYTEKRPNKLFRWALNICDFLWHAHRRSVMDELNDDSEIILGLCHSNGKLSSDEIQCLSFCKCDRRANSEGRKFSRVDSAGSWNRNPMRVNRIGLVTSLSLHHHHHHHHHYYCRHVNRVYRIGIEASFLLQEEQSFQLNPRTMIAWSFDALYSKRFTPDLFVSFSWLELGLLQKMHFLWCSESCKACQFWAAGHICSQGGKIKLDFQPLVEAEQPAGW